ncbi:phage tail protein [Pantoea stewartii]|uniref:Phage tail protein n=1 Tax=Pantoea stewartii subsp. stewartii DC283 TaxID=660596 RepID=H3RDP8_PANSE|nr:phage tail protein [Pantoea stewartii]ARF50036.1 phage tail protein [Pantoea stewartii subsp. stewartii DC283]EHU00487.1 phage tail sheath protein FI [Pantoea stewartii subsp. stewartii DC283]
MPVYQTGSLNTTALSAADLYVGIQAPKTRYINGVASDGLGLVGIASWGPVNSPVLIGSDTDQALYFGSQQVRKYDLCTAIAISLQIGATNLKCVRVTDGTDLAAAIALKDTATPTAATGMTLTAKYSGTKGNGITAKISTGTAVNSYKLTVYFPGQTPEVFDNITGSGAALWASLVSAVNNGITAVRGASQFVVATVGTSTSVPDTTTMWQLTGGTDGATTITDSVLVGTDGTSTTRTGMYALRGAGVQMLNLIDLTDSTQWPTINTFCLSEGAFGVVQAAAGVTYATLAATLNTSGVDSWQVKVLVGDWVYWNDTLNGLSARMCAPATFVAAKYAAQSPSVSALNKPITNVVATQRQLANQPYSISEIGALSTARLDVITNPCPGGNYFGLRSGRNAASSTTQNDDTYTRMTNYLSATLAASFGYVVGEGQTTDLRRSTKATIESFLQNLADEGMIGDPNGGPAFSVKLDATNNPSSRVALGYMVADVQVKYLATVRYFLINLEGGASVNVSVSSSATI